MKFTSNSRHKGKSKRNVSNRDGDFADFSAYADFFFSAFNLPHFCGFLQFRALIREREREKCGKNAYKITLTEPQRETAHKKYP